MDRIYIFIQVIIYIIIMILIIVIINKQNNVIEKFLINLIFLVSGTIIALTGLHLTVSFPRGKYIKMKEPIIFSLLFITLLLILMLYNMYYIWGDIYLLRSSKTKWQRIMYKNRLFFFIISVVMTVSIIICSYGFIYFIINNLPSNISSDLKGNFMDDGRRKSFIECLYFSGVTFFEVGYGDMVPRGSFFNVIVLLEMMTSYLLNIISIPILISIFTGNNSDVMRKNMFKK